MKRIDQLFQYILVFQLILTPIFYTGADTASSNDIRTNKIKEWEDITVEKGFILSNHLYYDNLCINIWDKQIPEFVKVNPLIKNPDNIPIGSKIKVQRCFSKKPIVELKKDVNILDEHRMEFILGMFNEDRPELGAGFDVFGAFSDNLGYRMFMVGAPAAIIYFANAEFRTSPAELRYFLSAGLGQRVGLRNKEENRIHDGVDSFVHSGIGLIYQPKGTFYWKAEAGVNVSQRASGNLEISAMKRFNNYWLGGFFQLKSTRSLIDNTEKDRNYIFSGLKVSF